jgi:glucosamine--fructose-6-phosphate aminotransferase (isomerizing)
MDESTLVIMLNPSDLTYSDTLTSAKEIKVRGAKIIGISDKFDETYDFWLEILICEKISSIIFEVVMIQLLSYHAAVLKNVDPDYQRNLAKSVTVK